MRAAGAIFFITGIACLGWGVRTVASYGVPVSWAGLRYWGATAAFLYVAYILFRAVAGARWLAIFVSACLVAACGVVLSAVFLPDTLIHPIAATPWEWWATIGAFLTLCVAHLAAILLLLFARPRCTDPSLRTP